MKRNVIVVIVVLVLLGLLPAVASAHEEATAVAAQASVLSTIARWIEVAGGSLLLGVFCFHLLLWRPLLDGEDLSPAESALDARFCQRSLRLGGVGVGAVLAGAVLGLLAGGPAVGDPAAAGVTEWLTSTTGLAWVARVVLSLVTVAWLLLMARENRSLRRRFWAGGAVLGLLTAITLSAGSHSVGLGRGATAAFLVDLVHVLAAGIWFGGVAALVAALASVRGAGNESQPLDEESQGWLGANLLASFLALGAMAVGAMLATGAFLASRHVAAWPELVDTEYGRALLGKVGLAILPLAIGMWNLLVVKPRLIGMADSPQTATTRQELSRLGWLLRAELILALLVLAASAALTDLPRAADAAAMAMAPTEQGLAAEAAADHDHAVDATGEHEHSLDLAEQPVANEHDHAAEATAEATADEHVHTAEEGGAHDHGIESSEASLGTVGRLFSFVSRTQPLVPGVALVLFSLAWGLVASRAALRDWHLVPLLSISLLSFWVGGLQLFRFSQVYTPAMFATNPIAMDEGSLAEGKALFEANCVRCHGFSGRGDGQDAATFAVPPANFASGHTATHPDGDLFYWIKDGIEGTPMPAWDSQFTDEEIWHLVNYVRHLSTMAPDG